MFTGLVLSVVNRIQWQTQNQKKGKRKLHIETTDKNWLQQRKQCPTGPKANSLHTVEPLLRRTSCYFGGARSKGFATLRNVSKLTFFDKIGHTKAVGFRYYPAFWRSESQISSTYLEIASISLIYSLTFSKKKELLFWLSQGLNWLTCVTRKIIGDSKLRD